MTNIHAILGEHTKQFAMPIANAVSTHRPSDPATRICSLRRVADGVLDESADVYEVEWRDESAIMIRCEDANVAYSTSTAGMADALGAILDETAWVIDYVSNEDVPGSIATVIDGRREVAPA